MRGPWSWRLQIVVLLSLSLVPLARASDADEAKPAAQDEEKSSWWSRLFGTGPRKAADKKADAAAKDPDPKSPPGEDKDTNLEDVAARERGRAQAAFFRRLAVCDQLMQIAEETNDRALELQVEHLSQQSWDMYSRTMAHYATANAALSESASPGDKEGMLGGQPETAKPGPLANPFAEGGSHPYTGIKGEMP
jgi:hypothetical protein